MSGDKNPDYKKFTDEELILRFQKEDIEAFNEIVFRYKDRIVNFLYRYTSNREDSEDIAQEAFIRLYKSKHLYKEIAKFSTWFYTIAINIGRTNLRKKSKFRTMPINNFYEDSDKDYELTSKTTLPDEDANAVGENYYIQKAINSLEDIHKEVIILRDVQDVEYDEISKILDLPLGTVKSRINRARESLKITLQEFHKTKKN
ncbi:MAG: sigma-70 family RNA polymerase sigma factor [Bacteroidota bacterium]|nr:sigma-70 family RNA polymerase sigma factor [Bacteroidota bacterium]